MPDLTAKKLTIFKNSLAHIERSAPLSKRQEDRCTEHVLNIKKAHKALAVDTLNVHAPPGVTHTVCYDRAIKLEDAGATFEFDFGAGVGLGAFMASCVGAACTVEAQVAGVEVGAKGGVKTVKGAILSVEKGRVAVEGTDEVHEVFTSLQLLENGCKMSRIEVCHDYQSPSATQDPTPNFLTPSLPHFLTSSLLHFLTSSLPRFLAPPCTFSVLQLGRVNSVTLDDPFLQSQLAEALQRSIKRKTRSPQVNTVPIRIVTDNVPAAAAAAEEGKVDELGASAHGGGSLSASSHGGGGAGAGVGGGGGGGGGGVQEGYKFGDITRGLIKGATRVAANTLNSLGGAQQELTVSYVTPAHSWACSYRLELPSVEVGGAHPSTTPLLDSPCACFTRPTTRHSRSPLNRTHPRTTTSPR
mmetsp:Transcript_9548/g.24281  ORF Transcript_9548/g.24281 Transcript_9548/m.24281 type:complete len:413 (-) Transcript_9548:386-1624(-)